MGIFHKFHSRQLLFSLEVISLLKTHGELNLDQLNQIAKKCGLEYADQCLPWLFRASILEPTSSGVRLAPYYVAPAFPLSAYESEYLSYILKQQEAALFLNQRIRNKLSEQLSECIDFSWVQYYGPKAVEEMPPISTEEFSILLNAIQNRRWIQYRYRTEMDDTYRDAQTIPWKLEFDTFDHRWWLIHFNPMQNRTIKSILGNLRDFRLGEKADITDEQIQNALEKLLAPESIVLRIIPERNALERCALVFERQMLRQIQPENENHYLLSFQYYAFDELEILRKILYLGPSVQLISPKSMCQKLLELINIALER